MTLDEVRAALAKIPTFSTLGLGLLGCDVCGSVVSTGGQDKHIDWHAQVSALANTLHS